MGARADLGHLDRHRADAGDDRALGQVAVADHRGAAMLIPQASVTGQQLSEFGLNRLLNQALGTGLQ